MNIMSLLCSYLQLPCLCEFPSDEFYDGRLKTSHTVLRRYERKLQRLDNFWPRGTMKPFAFCNVVGSEDEHRTSQDTAAPVGVESKKNNREAKKIVSCTWMCKT